MSTPFITLNAGKVTAQVDQINKNLDGYRERYIRALTKAVVQFSYHMGATAQGNLGPVTRTGGLAASFSVQDAVLSGTQISCVSGFRSPYAAQRNFGGPIYPSKARMLAIPLDPALTGRGAPRFSSPRDVPGGFVLKLWGRAFIAAKRGKTDKTITLFYVLKDHVEQQGNGFFTKAIEAHKGEAAQQIAQATRAFISETT